MTDFLYPDILNEQLTYARQARAAWLWTNVAERSRIFLQVLDTLQPICASLARDSVQETGYGIFEDRMLMITRLLRDLRSCCLQTESPFSERLSCTDTRTQIQPSGTLLGIPSSIHPVTETLFAAAIAIQTVSLPLSSFLASIFQPKQILYLSRKVQNSLQESSSQGRAHPPKVYSLKDPSSHLQTPCRMQAVFHPRHSY